MRKGRGLTRSEVAGTVGARDFVRRVITTIKPRLAVEHRAEAGFTLPLLEGLNENGFGKLIVCGDAEKLSSLRKETTDFELSPSALLEIRDQSAAESKFDETIDLLVCSGNHEPVLRHLLPEINPFGLLLLYAGEGEHKAMRDGVSRMEKEGIISVVRLPESLRLLMAQKRSGRK